MSSLVPVVPDAERAPVWGWDRVRTLVLASVSSPHSKRAYAQALDEFWKWCQESAPGGFTRETVQRYRAWLEAARNLAPSSRNLHLTVIRKLAREAAANGILAQETAAGIAGAKGTRQKGARLSVWLTLDQAHALLRAPTGDGLRAKRDRALLALLVGCGLRRSELADLTADRIQQREGRWVLVDLEGKGNRVRSVPMPITTSRSLGATATTPRSVPWLPSGSGSYTVAGPTIRLTTSGSTSTPCGGTVRLWCRRWPRPPPENIHRVAHFFLTE